MDTKSSLFAEASGFTLSAYHVEADLWVSCTSRTPEDVGRKTSLLNGLGFVVLEVGATFDLTPMLQQKQAEADNAKD